MAYLRGLRGLADGVLFDPNTGDVAAAPTQGNVPASGSPQSYPAGYYSLFYPTTSPAKSKVDPVNAALVIGGVLMLGMLLGK